MSNIIWFLIIGALSGWLAGMFVKGHGFDIWVDIIVSLVSEPLGSLGSWLPALSALLFCSGR